MKNIKSAASKFSFVILAVLVLATYGLAASKTTIYNFTGFKTFPADGALPLAGVTFDKAGNLYGTTTDGGNEACLEGGECGIVYRLTPPAQTGGAWTESILFEFGAGGQNSGGDPVFGVTIDQAGEVLGSDDFFVYRLVPGSGGTLPWTFQQIYDPAPQQLASSPTLDSAGNLYLTTAGTFGSLGSVFELKNQNGASPKTLWSFTGGADGAGPAAGVIRDSKGNLYGMAGSFHNPGGCGEVYELVPNAKHTAYTENTLYNFSGPEGCIPSPYNLILDANGNLYGSTAVGGTSTLCQLGCGTVFELSPPVSGGSWTFQLLYDFQGGTDGATPSGVVRDAKGALYGTTQIGGTGFCLLNGQSVGCGTIFKLTPPTGGGTWSETILHSLQGGSDGQEPNGVTIGPDKALYGTTELGGSFGEGTVFRILR